MPKSSHRQSHRKSRNGCIMCKKRHVKCDEVKPTCGNCGKFSTECDYNSETTAAASSRKLGRPQKSWTSDNQSLTSGLPPTLPDDSPGHQQQIPQLDLDDLELLHHYATSTYSVFGHDPIQTMFRVNVPTLGFTYPFVLRLTLAMAARHLQRLQPENKSEHYSALAEKHFSVTLAEVLHLLPNLDSENCQALYISAIFICIYFFARGPAPGEYLVFGKNGPSQFLPLLRGVRTIMESLGPDIVFSGPLAPMHAGPSPKHAENSTAERDCLPEVRWQEPVQKLHQFISSLEDRDAVNICLPALNSLSEIFEATYGKDDRSYQGDVNNQIVLRWLYCLNGDFILYLQHKQPIALIICAYFALIMKVLDLQQCWFMNGWAEHILIGVRASLGPEYQVWLHWPMEQAGVVDTSGQIQP